MIIRIPPPLIALIFAALMWGVTTISASALVVESVILFPLSMIVLMIGLVINIVAVVSFRIANTTLNPMKPNNTTQLVKTGIYQFSRNPMYLGVFFILSAWAIWLGSPFNIAILLFFIWYITMFQIIPEENALEVLFIEEFESYKSKVRRWI